MLSSKLFHCWKTVMKKTANRPHLVTNNSLIKTTKQQIQWPTELKLQKSVQLEIFCTLCFYWKTYFLCTISIINNNNKSTSELYILCKMKIKNWNYLINYIDLEKKKRELIFLPACPFSFGAVQWDHLQRQPRRAPSGVAVPCTNLYPRRRWSRRTWSNEARPTDCECLQSHTHTSQRQSATTKSNYIGGVCA